MLVKNAYCRVKPNEQSPGAFGKELNEISEPGTADYTAFLQRCAEECIKSKSCDTVVFDTAAEACRLYAAGSKPTHCDTVRLPCCVSMRLIWASGPMQSPSQYVSGRASL